MENIFEGNMDQFNQLIDEAIPDNIGMTDEEYESMIDAQIAAEFAKLDSKNQQPQSNQTQSNSEKETEMNTQTQAQETLNVVTETVAGAVAESNTKVVAKKVAIILGKEKLVELTGKRNLVFIKSDDKDGMKNVLLS